MSTPLRPYPTYKPSGVEWLGDVPEHWGTVRLKHVSRFTYGDSLPGEERAAGNVPVFGSNGRVGWHDAANTLAPAIIVGRKGSYGKVNFSSSPCFAIDTTFYIDARATKHNLRWLFYLLNWARLDTASKDSAVPGLDRNDAYERNVPLPPPDEQAAIVRFLDHMDAAIRRYIQAKRRLIALLTEQKQAIIHQAVTQGLDPSAPRKPSGVEWLGDIPAHWRIARLKFIATHIVDCLHATPIYSEVGEYPAIRTADVQPGMLLLESARRVDEEQYRRWIARMTPVEGDILYTREGERFGIAALVPPGIRLCISQRMMAFRIHERWNPVYVMWQINSRPVYAQAAADQIGAAAPHVNVERIRNFWLALPSRPEQDAIVAFVERESRQLNLAIDRAYSEIKLLREYRTRLVADVVTGQLDVRGVALPEHEEEIDKYPGAESEGETVLGEDDLETPDGEWEEA